MERLGDQALVHLRPIRMCGVDEVDLELDRSPKHSASLVGIARLAPDAGAGQAHRAVAETVDRQRPKTERACVERSHG